MLNITPSPAMRKPTMQPSGGMQSPQSSGGMQPKPNPSGGPGWGRLPSRTMSGQVGAQKPPIMRPMQGPTPQMGPGMPAPSPMGPSSPMMGPSGMLPGGGMNMPPMGNTPGEIQADMPNTAGTPPGMIMPPSSMPVLYGPGGPTNGMNSPIARPGQMNNLWSNYRNSTSAY